jgi:hypothetical protein
MAFGSNGVRPSDFSEKSDWSNYFRLNDIWVNEPNLCVVPKSTSVIFLVKILAISWGSFFLSLNGAMCK